MDGRGRLESAEDPRDGTKTLARADGLSDYTVTVTSGLGRAAYRGRGRPVECFGANDR
jgi:hypothetical protein